LPRQRQFRHLSHGAAVAALQCSAPNRMILSRRPLVPGRYKRKGPAAFRPPGFNCLAGVLLSCKHHQYRHRSTKSEDNYRCA
jgi:hypothetical protein